MDFVSQVALLIVGWVIGLLSTPITTAIQRRRERLDLAAAIETELQEIRERMLVVAYAYWRKVGELTPARLEHITAVLERSSSNPALVAMAKNLREIIAAAAGELEILNTPRPTRHERPDELFRARAVQAPFLESNLARLAVFRRASVRALLSIESQFRLYNQLVDEFRELSASIEGADASSMSVVFRHGQTLETERAIAERAEYIADRIGEIRLT